VIRETKKVVELIAILGGQWPHSSFIVPGGIVSVPGPADLLQCRHILRQYRRWYEERILGCSVARWRDVRSAADLSAWLDEDERHRQGELGFFIRFARALGLDAPGRPSGGFLSYGALDLPEGTSVTAPGGGRQLIPGGFANGGGVHPFDQARIAEHVAYSWFEDQEGGRHPLAGETRPYATGHESRKYSWAKAPRYEGLPAETGPLAEALVAGDALFASLVGERGPSVLSREMARLVRPASLLPAMETWLGETGDDFYRPVGEIVEGTGFGLTQATRGALGHWVRIEKGRIERYQVIAPTTWNASPRDGAGVRGPMEEALVGTAVKDPENPVELGHVVRSFDPCLVCTVHAVSRGRSLGRLRVGA
jgi:hydrogenase large subunit